jgi:hypothetical protein
MTNKEAISEVINDLKALRVDDRISERYVLSKLKHYNSLFLKRENDQLRLFWYDNIWLTVECIDMEEVPYSECADIRIPNVNQFVRSKNKVADIYSYKNGPLVRELMSLDEGNLYHITTPREYANILKREFPGTKRYFWFRNGHLVIPKFSVKQVSITAVFKDPEKARAMSSCTDKCMEPLEEEFPCPEHLYEVVKQETIKDLFTYYKRTIPDTTPNLDNASERKQS